MEVEKFNHPLIWFVPISVLCVSFLPVPIGFYALIRLVVTASSVYLAYLERKKNERVSTLVIVFVVIALLFNPIIKIHFGKMAWHFIDIVIICFFIIHFLRFNKR